MKKTLFTILLSCCFCFFTFTLSAQTAPVANAGNDTTVCEGDIIVLNGSGSGGTQPLYFQWACSNPPCSFSNPFLPNPTYGPATGCDTLVFQVIDGNGIASNVDTVIICANPIPVVDAGPDIYLCPPPAPGQLIAPTVYNAQPPFIYDWQPPTGLNANSIASPYARPDTTTIYTLTVTSLISGCVSSPFDTNASVTVFVQDAPIADAGIDFTVCNGDTIQFQGVGFGAGPNYSFEWSPPTGLSDPYIANPTCVPPHGTTINYMLFVESNGCYAQTETGVEIRSMFLQR